jgi:hypothetical protein
VEAVVEAEVEAELAKYMITLLDIHRRKKKIFERMGLGVLCDWLQKRTFIRPNHITLINLFVGVGACVSLFNDLRLTSGLIILMMLIDGFDGYYAVRNNLKTKTGEILDHGGDLIIGVIMLIKSYWYFDEPWIILLPIFFIGEWLLIWWNEWQEEKFPERDFIYLFIFGWYWQGLVVQLVMQPMILGYFLFNRMRGAKIGY